MDQCRLTSRTKVFHYPNVNNQYVTNPRNYLKHNEDHHPTILTTLHGKTSFKQNLKILLRLCIQRNHALGKKALFLLPTEAVRKKFIEEMTRVVVVGPTNADKN